MSELAAVLLMLAAPLLGQEAAEEDFDPDQYPALALADVIHEYPCAPGRGLEVKDALFSSELTYRPLYRDVPARRRELIRAWAARLDSADQAGEFSREIRLEDGRSARWFPIPSNLIPHLRQEVAPGGRAVFYLSLVGCADGEPVVAVEEYALPGYPDLEEEASSYIA